jgi:hypothetical protein
MVRALCQCTRGCACRQIGRERGRERDARTRTHKQIHTRTHTHTYTHIHTHTHTQNSPLPLPNTHRYAVITTSELYLAQENVENSKALVKIPLQDVNRVEGSMARCVCVRIHTHTHTRAHSFSHTQTHKHTNTQTHTSFPRVCLRVRAAHASMLFNRSTWLLEQICT